MKLKSPRDADAPIWARYKAKDDDGTWHWFESKPNYYKKTGQWCAKGQSAQAKTESRNAAY